MMSAMISVPIIAMRAVLLFFEDETFCLSIPASFPLSVRQYGYIINYNLSTGHLSLGQFSDIMTSGYLFTASEKYKVGLVDNASESLGMLLEYFIRDRGFPALLDYESGLRN